MPSDTIEKVRRELEAVGRRWHEVNKHTGPYGSCPKPTCYHTHSRVAA